jgi:hypothetical protein
MKVFFKDLSFIRHVRIHNNSFGWWAASALSYAKFPGGIVTQMDGKSRL